MNNLNMYTLKMQSLGWARAHPATLLDTPMSRCIAKSINLEKPKQLIIWYGVSTSELFDSIQIIWTVGWLNTSTLQILL